MGNVNKNKTINKKTFQFQGSNFMIDCWLGLHVMIGKLHLSANKGNDRVIFTFVLTDSGKEGWLGLGT